MKAQTYLQNNLAAFAGEERRIPNRWAGDWRKIRRASLSRLAKLCDYEDRARWGKRTEDEMDAKHAEADAIRAARGG